MLVGVDLFLDLAGNGLVRSPWRSSRVGGLIQRVDVAGFILHRAQNVAKELDLLTSRAFERVARL